jgi:hypothetical protein
MTQLDFSKKILTELRQPNNETLFNKEFVKCLFWIRNDRKSYNSLITWVISILNNKDDKN